MELDNLLKLIETVSGSSLSSFKYQEGNLKISMETVGKQTTAALIPQDKHALYERAKEDSHMEIPEGNLIKSPLVGTFYAAPSEDSDPFVKLGETVKKGQVLAIVEAMKLMNDIECEWDGVITEIYVENGQAVEYGQPLFRVGKV